MTNLESADMQESEDVAVFVHEQLEHWLDWYREQQRYTCHVHKLFVPSGPSADASLVWTLVAAPQHLQCMFAVCGNISETRNTTLMGASRRFKRVGEAVRL